MTGFDPIRDDNPNPPCEGCGRVYGCDCREVVTLPREPMRYSLGIDLAHGDDRSVAYLAESAPTGCVTAPRIVMIGEADATVDYAAMFERRKDAIREALDLVPAPAIEEARPMNRKQRRDAARRGR